MSFSDVLCDLRSYMLHTLYSTRIFRDLVPSFTPVNLDNKVAVLSQHLKLFEGTFPCLSNVALLCVSNVELKKRFSAKSVFGPALQKGFVNRTIFFPHYSSENVVTTIFVCILKNTMFNHP